MSTSPNSRLTPFHSCSRRAVFPRLVLAGLLCVPALAASAEQGAGVGSGMAAALVTVLLVAVVLAALMIFGIVFWSRKQEHIQDMLLFCMKYLIHSEDEAERISSAKALGRANDPRALLVLLNVTWDEEESDGVRTAASAALHDMGVHHRKYKGLIDELEAASERKDYQGIIDILMNNFERGSDRQVQSAYIIGRHHMRLRRYVDAREWLTKAEARNRKFNLYGNRIVRWIRECNVHLLDEADDAFRAGDFQMAKEHYAAFDHGLSEEDRQRCAVYLREACVYCKLEDYLNADQSLLTALRRNHGTDLALTLVPLLQEIVNPDDKSAPLKPPSDETRIAIDQRVGEIMNALWVRDPWKDQD